VIRDLTRHRKQFFTLSEILESDILRTNRRSSSRSLLSDSLAADGGASCLTLFLHGELGELSQIRARNSIHNSRLLIIFTTTRHHLFALACDPPSRLVIESFIHCTGEGDANQSWWAWGAGRLSSSAPSSTGAAATACSGTTGAGGATCGEVKEATREVEEPYPHCRSKHPSIAMDVV
jgi:hypothetical protein